MTRQREERAASMYPLFTHRETDRASQSLAQLSHSASLTTSLASGSVRRVTRSHFRICAMPGMCSERPAFFSARKGGPFFTPATSISTIRRSCKRAVFPESGVDVLIIETTRGDTPLPEGFSRDGGGTATRGRDRSRFHERRLRSDAGVRARQNAGSARDDLQIPAAEIARSISRSTSAA